MPARKKTFRGFVADGTFLARRHAHYLESEPLLEDVTLAKLQKAYVRESSELERQAIALRFQKAVKGRAKRQTKERAGELVRELKTLGPAWSARQVIGFFPRFLCWDDLSPFVLDGWQQEFVTEAYRRDRRGRRIYKEILLGIPRGNGKTPLCTGLGIHTMLVAPGRPKIFQAAGSGDQAAIGLEYAAAWVEDGPLAEYLRPPSARRLSRRDGRGSFSIMPASGALGHGKKPDAALVDEWWAFKDKRQEQTFTALETAMHKQPWSFLLEASTAGWDLTSQLGESYTSALELPDIEYRRDGFHVIARDRAAGRLMWWYGLPPEYELDLDNDAAVLLALQLANPGSWIDHPELLRALRRTRDVFEWLRLNLNSWTKTKGQWLPAGVWGRLESDLKIPPGAGVHVAVDAAHSYDTTAVAWAWKHPSGRIVVRCYVFSAREDAPAHDAGAADEHGTLDNEKLVEPFIHELVDQRGYRVRSVSGDPAFFRTELRHLSRRFNVVEEFQGGSDMLQAVQQFYRGATTGLYAHNADAVLQAHVAGVEGRKDSEGLWRIKKLVQSSPIDAATAVIMATWRALNDDGSEDWMVVR